MQEEIFFGEWLRNQRRALDLSRRAFAEQVGCAEITLRRIEEGTLKPSKELALILLEKLGIPESERSKWILFARGNSQVPSVSTDQVVSANSKIHLATFLFTDIEDSTKLWETAPEQMKAALQRHHVILQKTISSKGGTIFQIVGDAFCAVFPTAHSAISAAVTAQIELHQEPWDLPFPIRVRMGIHTGEAQPIPSNSPTGGYASNQTLNRVARILQAGHGGQILLSLATKELAKDLLPANTEVRDMGEHYLRNLIHPEHLFQLIISGLLSDFSPLKTLGSTRHNLPIQLTNFIGREKEQFEVMGLITKHQLITLTGSGGVGKTRLSLKVGEQVLENYADGVWLLELASLNDPALLPQTAAALVGLTTQSDIPYIDLIINFLRPKTVMLILDNCEHLIDECAHFTDTLLRNCSQLKILATSREPLGIPGEAIYRVPSLALPNLEQQLDTFRDFESLKLFEERAQLAQFDFSLTLENVSSIAQICHRLDGIPLAIELAAAKIEMLSPEHIAKQLDQSFNLLTGGSRTALPRHQTLHASMDWSWGLLTKAEQIFLRQLSVFAGGWTLDAAYAVYDDEVLELTHSLVKKSLIVMDREGDRDTRYRFHEIVHQYTHEKLVAAGEEEKIRTRHMHYFLRLVEEVEPELTGPTQMQWYARLKDERDNLRAALGWADQTDLEVGLYLLSRFVRFWYIFDLREGNYWLSRFLQRSESSAYPEARAKALYSHALILEVMQQFDEARSAAEECLKLFRALGNQEGEIDGLLALAWDAWTTASERTELMQQALELAQSLGDVPRQVEALLNLGYSDQSNNRFTYWEEAIELSRSLGDARGLASSLSHIGFYLALCGHIESAQKHLDEADMLYQKFHMNPPPRDLLSAHGQIALIRRDYEKARTYFQESARIHAEFGNQHEYFEARVRLGYVALREGKLAEARHILIETAQNFQKDKYAMGVAFALDGIANICLTLNKTDYAAHLIGWADGIHEKTGDLRPVTEQTDMDKVIFECIAKMGKAKFSEAYEEGKKMSLDEAVAYALKD